MRDFQKAYRENSTADRGGENAQPEDFAALAEAFRDFLEGHGLSPATVRARLDGLRVLGRYAEAHEISDLRQMSRTQVDAYVADLRKRKLSPRTVENWLGTCKRFFYFLVETNRLLISPAEHLRERNLSHIMGPVVSAKEADRLLAVPNTSLPLGVRDRMILEVLYGTGLRRSEVTALTIFDVDLAGGLVRVQHGKGDKERLVPLGQQAQKWCKLYLENVRPVLCRRLHGRDGEPALLLGRDGKPLSRDAVAMIVKMAGKAAGVRASCHTLRRTMATELLKGGAKLPAVAAILGHAHLSATQRYTKVASADLRRVHREKHPRGK
jgi:integrase/recombinase XerD